MSEDYENILFSDRLLVKPVKPEMTKAGFVKSIDPNNTLCISVVVDTGPGQVNPAASGGKEKWQSEGEGVVYIPPHYRIGDLVYYKPNECIKIVINSIEHHILPQAAVQLGRRKIK